VTSAVNQDGDKFWARPGATQTENNVKGHLSKRLSSSRALESDGFALLIPIRITRDVMYNQSARRKIFREKISQAGVREAFNV
jgi:hypothetical protein